MAALPQGWNDKKRDPVGFQPIPQGHYLAAVIKSEEKETQAGDGAYVKLEYEILDGEYKGRKLWSQHNTRNKSETAAKIGLDELYACCLAAGLPAAGDTCEIHDLPICIFVKVAHKKDFSTGKDTEELTNVIKAWKHRDEYTKSQSAPATAGSPAPWKK